MRKPTRQPTAKDRNQWANHYAILAGEPLPPQEIERPKRVYTKRQAPEASESAIQKAIMQLLRHHPKVARVWRQNSGVAQYGTGSETRYVRANTARGMSDIMGVLKDGRMLAIEVKSAGGTVQAHQHEFLKSITDAGGIAFVARDVDTVVRVLEAL